MLANQVSFRSSSCTNFLHSIFAGLKKDLSIPIKKIVQLLKVYFNLISVLYLENFFGY